MSELSVGWSRRARLIPHALHLRVPRALRLPRVVSARHGGMLVAAAIAIAGVLLAWQAALLDLGNFDLPGPGFFPLVLGAAMVTFAIAIGVDRWRSAEGEAVELGHRDVLVTVAALLAVPLLFEPLGALPTLGLFGVTMLVLVARVHPLLAVAASALGMAACWYFFQVLLGLQLPTGPL
jgi:putative tricarboxylic transport membrane protein